MVRSKRKPIILHGCRGCGAEFDFIAPLDLHLEPSCNMQSDLRVRLGWSIKRFGRIAKQFPILSSLPRSRIS